MIFPLFPASLLHISRFPFPAFSHLFAMIFRRFSFRLFRCLRVSSFAISFALSTLRHFLPPAAFPKMKPDAAHALFRYVMVFLIVSFHFLLSLIFFHYAFAVLHLFRGLSLSRSDDVSSLSAPSSFLRTAFAASSLLFHLHFAYTSSLPKILSHFMPPADS